MRLEALSAINKCLTGKVVPECLVDRYVSGRGVVSLMMYYLSSLQEGDCLRRNSERTQERLVLCCIVVVGCTFASITLDTRGQGLVYWCCMGGVK